MKWFNALCAVFLIGCTIKVEPLTKKPTAIKHVHHHRKLHRHPSPTPTIAPMKTPVLPMHLEPTDKPTPMIKFSNVSLLKLGDQPMF